MTFGTRVVCVFRIPHHFHKLASHIIVSGVKGIRRSHVVVVLVVNWVWVEFTQMLDNLAHVHLIIPYLIETTVERRLKILNFFH